MRDAKQTLRTSLRKRRRLLSAAEIAELSRRVCERVCALPLFAEARRLILYSADDNEVPTEGIWQTAMAHDKAVYYPRIVDDTALEFVCRAPGERLVPGTFGILVPPAGPLLQPLLATDLVLTPGVAFDRRGNRLGRGRGYYDRAFRTVLAGGVRVGLAFELQLVRDLPVTVGDVAVDYIVTERRLIVCAETITKLPFS